MYGKPEIILDLYEYKIKLTEPWHTTCILTAGSIKPKCDIESILDNCV